MEGCAYPTYIEILRAFLRAHLPGAIRTFEGIRQTIDGVPRPTSLTPYHRVIAGVQRLTVAAHGRRLAFRAASERAV